jgi:hypothetical protein
MKMRTTKGLVDRKIWFLYRVRIIDKSKRNRIIIVVQQDFRNRFRVIEDNNRRYKSAIEIQSDLELRFGKTKNQL